MGRSPLPAPPRAGAPAPRVRLDPVSAAAARWLAWRAAAGLIVVAVLFAAAALVPMQVYKPSCGRAPKWGLNGRPRIDGPLRPEYVEMFTHAMREEGFRYWRVRDAILVPLLPIFDGNSHWDWTDFIINNEWRIAYSIVNGYTADGCAPPPEAVRRLYGDIKGTCGVPPERLPEGRVVYPPSFWIRGDCNLLRAAVIRIEDMPWPLPVLEGPSAFWDKKAGPPETGPAPQRW